MKTLLFSLIIFFSFIKSSDGQEYSRDVIITTDTTREFNNTRKNPFKIVDTYIQNGLELRLYESPFQVGSITSKVNDNLNGFYLEFYPTTNMPKIRGNYIESDKDGEWFYWNEKGKLMKKEVWKKGKLIKTQTFT
jgi:antitoxin component YwqK of YwqJK toxin-antitoxin module